MAKRRKTKRPAGARGGTQSAAHAAAAPRGASSGSPRAATPRLLPPWALVTLLALLCLAFYSPIVFAGDAFGVNDWDMMLFHHEAARRSLVLHGAWPTWNPWYCGGGPLLANPQSVFLDPLFSLVLALGTVEGARLSVAAHAFVGMLGAWLLARRLGAPGRAGLVAAVVWGFAGVYTLHIATGHLTWFALGYLPFVAACTEGALVSADEGDGFRAAREAALAAAALAATLFTGNAYVFVYGALLVALRTLLSVPGVRPLSRAWRPLAVGAAIGSLGACLAAVKLVPMLEYLGRVSRYEVKDASGAPLERIWSALTTRDPSLTALQWPGMQWRWWEYGGYVGVPVLLLAAVGVAVTWRRTWPWAVTALFFLGLAMGNEGPVWPLLRGLQAFEGLRVPSRAIAVVVLAAAAFAAVGVGALIEYAVKSRGLAATAAPGILGLVLAALVTNAFAVTRPTLEEAFTAPPHAPPPAEVPPFQQAFGKRVFVTRTPYTDHYEHALANRGMLNCHERLHLPISARAPLLRNGAPDAAYRGELWSRDGKRTVELRSFGPAEIVADVKGEGVDVITLNQNFDPGWTARLGGAALPVKSIDGVLGVEVPADAPSGELGFSYRPPHGRAGLVFSGLGLILCLGVLVGAQRRSGKGVATSSHTAGDS